LAVANRFWFIPLALSRLMGHTDVSN
jgi:hypothetical protein